MRRTSRWTSATSPPWSARGRGTARPGRCGLGVLPRWFDDWVIAERERVRQEILHRVEGNAVAARGSAEHVRQFLHRELGVTPAHQLRAPLR